MKYAGIIADEGQGQSRVSPFCASNDDDDDDDDTMRKILYLAALISVMSTVQADPDEDEMMIFEGLPTNSRKPWWTGRYNSFIATYLDGRMPRKANKRLDKLKLKMRRIDDDRETVYLGNVSYAPIVDAPTLSSPLLEANPTNQTAASLEGRAFNVTVFIVSVFRL